jgi:hypothetical protein
LQQPPAYYSSPSIPCLGSVGGQPFHERNFPEKYNQFYDSLEFKAQKTQLHRLFMIINHAQPTT